MPYLFATVVVVLCLLLVVIIIICFRYRMKTCCKGTRENSYSSPAHYCATGFNSSPSRYGRGDKEGIFYTNGLFEGRANIGKRLSGCDRREADQTESKASLSLIDCKKASPNMNGTSLRRKLADQDRLYSCLSESITSPDEPAVIVWDKVAQTTSLRDRLAAKNYFRQKKPNVHSNETPSESMELPSVMAGISISSPACLQPSQHHDSNVYRHVSVVTVTSFGPNETINTEVW